MDHLNSLSDNELRQRLRQYGFPNLPITSTTRKVLIKKLRNHMNSEQVKLRQATSFVTRYSSDEDASDQDTKRNQRATMPPPKTNNKRFLSSQPTKVSPRSQSVYVSPVVRHNDSEDDVDNESNNLNTSFSSAYSSSTNNRSYTLGPRTASSLYPASSQSFISGYDRSNHGGISKSRDQTATSNGHSDGLFTDYSHGLSSQYRRSALSTSSRKTFFLITSTSYILVMFTNLLHLSFMADHLDRRDLIAQLKT